MSVKDLMTGMPQCASKNTSLPEIAKMMDDCDCGMVPIVEQNGKTNILGTVTDRDITIRAVASGKNPANMNASDVMTGDPVCISQDADDNEAEELMGQHQIRRLIVTDENNNVVGVLAQADLARKEPEGETGRVVQNISKDSNQPRSSR